MTLRRCQGIELYYRELCLTHHGKERRGFLLLRWLSSEARPLDNLDKYAILLRECGTLGDYARGRRLHEKLVQEGLFGRFLGNLLVEMYGKCGSLEEARAVFNRIRTKNVFTWNLMAGVYTQNGRDREALRLYREMCVEGVAADDFTILAVLAACANLRCLKAGRAVLESIRGSRMILENSLVGSSIVSMLGKCGSVADAKSFFDDELSSKSTSSWNAMLAAYSQNSFGAEAILVFRSMLLEGAKADSVTFVSACGSIGSLAMARALHGVARSGGLESDSIVGNALVSMYGRCKSCEDSRNVFDRLAVRNIVSWTAMISAYGQCGHHREALELFEAMDCEPDRVVLASILDSCGSLCDLDSGRRIHERYCKALEEKSVQVGNALVEFYAKCGAVEDAVRSFERMACRDVQSWSSMIAVYSQSDRSDPSSSSPSAVSLFFRMALEGVSPNEFVLTHVLDACSHLGLESRARGLLGSMAEDHSIAASVEHYGCFVDLLGRLGELDRAQEAIELLPFQADAVMWIILLSACIVHGDVERGALVAAQIAGLDDDGASASACFVLAANSFSINCD
ncbi:pentatricopeptide repeat-containing protein At2g13600 [Selaginella moellendorffii]|uniref:pentatricopeptide repeat-containing protein At2g13600 n=1 Tax=Selaginella moellendorffii TaxID=88036 RepID=UPI000D1D04E1|nr:pentatricopeptide repeat-containing protein At2g13600 [Selaginella moellendorffii]|eukprot:XP_024514876.1 pentatricopeptide repeat-containing protein At2g13600 [Selaginella moellendorffii]